MARSCGFELAGVAPAYPTPDADRFLEWVASGMAGRMGYLTDHRAEMRRDPRSLLPSTRSIISVARLYNTPGPRTASSSASEGWISRYAWGEQDYHNVLRRDLEQFAARLNEQVGAFEYRICVDTAPLLERSYARLAGLGWIGKNTCLINQEFGSYIFLGEILTSLECESVVAAPDRCGTCTRCIDACPTAAIVPRGSSEHPGFAVDARRCISYFTIELKGQVPEEMRAGVGNHVFGCDICQDVCPWNSKAPVTADPAFTSADIGQSLEELAKLTPLGFRERFRGTPVSRTRYSGFLRNVALAMGNSRLSKFRQPLQELARSETPEVAEHACWALAKLECYEERTESSGTK